MTREQIIERQKELTNEWTIQTQEWLHGNGKRNKKREWEIMKENIQLQKQLDKLDGKTYDCDKWITKFIGSSYNSLKDARLDLINQIKDLHGVEVGDCKTGVVGVSVYTESKIYHYIIHAHYRVEIIKEWQELSPFGTITRQETRTIYEAYVEPNGQGWSWRY